MTVSILLNADTQFVDEVACALQALQVAKECEEKLEELKQPILELRGQADAEFDKVKITPTQFHSS